MNFSIRTESAMCISEIDCSPLDETRLVYYSSSLGETIQLNDDGETCTVWKH